MNIDYFNTHLDKIEFKPKREIVIKLEWKKIYIYYNYGHDKGTYLWFMNEKNKILDSIKIKEVIGTDYSKVFSIKNIITYYWWKVKQYLFWHNVHKPIGNFIKKHTNLDKTFYPINE